MFFSFIVAAAAVAVSAIPTQRSLLQNGLDAQALNYKYLTLSIQDDCQPGNQGCINGGFAQCVGGGFWEVVSCPASLICAALPDPAYQNGTAVACTFKEDALTRIAETGAAGGITGHDNSTTTATPMSTSTSSLLATSSLAPAVSTTSLPSASVSSSAATSSASTNATNPLLQSGIAAQQANEQYLSLNLKDICSPNGIVGCIAQTLANCNNAYWSLGASCYVPGTECFAVPNASGNGTSVGCYTPADASNLIEATGATGGIYGTGSASTAGRLHASSLCSLVVAALVAVFFA